MLELLNHCIEHLELIKHCVVTILELKQKDLKDDYAN